MQKCIGTKESVYIRKEFNSHRISLEHHDGRRDVMWKRSVEKAEKQKNYTRKLHEYVNKSVNDEVSRQLKLKIWDHYFLSGVFIEYIYISYYLEVTSLIQIECWMSDFFVQSLSNFFNLNAHLIRGKISRKKNNTIVVHLLKRIIKKFPVNTVDSLLTDTFVRRTPMM